jgi:hypothetical protein
MQEYYLEKTEPDLAAFLVDFEGINLGENEQTDKIDEYNIWLTLS